MLSAVEERRRGNGLGHQVVRHGLVPQAGRERDGHGQVGRRLGQRRATGDVHEDVVPRQGQVAAPLEDGGHHFEGLADNEMRVLLVAVKRSLISDHMGMIQSIGLQPDIIDVDAFAIGNAYEFRNSLAPTMEQDDRVTALIDVGAGKTNINVLRGGTLW